MNQSFFEYICVINLDTRSDRWKNMMIDDLYTKSLQREIKTLLG